VRVSHTRCLARFLYRTSLTFRGSGSKPLACRSPVGTATSWRCQSFCGRSRSGPGFFATDDAAGVRRPARIGATLRARRGARRPAINTIKSVANSDKHVAQIRIRGTRRDERSAVPLCDPARRHRPRSAGRHRSMVGHRGHMRRADRFSFCRGRDREPGPSSRLPLQLLDDLAQPLAFRSLGEQHRLEHVSVVGEGFGGGRHQPICHMAGDRRHHRSASPPVDVFEDDALAGIAGVGGASRCRARSRAPLVRGRCREYQQLN
jgi:hypothetical protein